MSEINYRLIRECFDRAEDIPPMSTTVETTTKLCLRGPDLSQLSRVSQLSQALTEKLTSLKLTKQQIEMFEERAAIMEFDGGLSREMAEYQALRCIMSSVW